ncbi:MAG: hypothetical protein K2J54_00695 [Clostridia bacterium]|nr:hypothetical protein [Clostridia bacterium]MDE7256771.1 hypothetical protein [Clostridia bacterium]
MDYVASYKEVSAELGKRLLKLYRVKIFPRQGKIFADMLFQTGIEAGTYIASLADIEERKMKIELASNAMIKLNQTEYLIRVMKEAGYYEPVHVADMEDYMEELLKAMRELLSNAFAQMRSEKNSVHIVHQPVVMPASAPAQSKPAPQIKINTDPDGFNSPAE